MAEGGGGDGDGSGSDAAGGGRGATRGGGGGVRRRPRPQQRRQSSLLLPQTCRSVADLHRPKGLQSGGAWRLRQRQWRRRRRRFRWLEDGATPPFIPFPPLQWWLPHRAGGCRWGV